MADSTVLLENSQLNINNSGNVAVSGTVTSQVVNPTDKEGIPSPLEVKLAGDGGLNIKFPNEFTLSTSQTRSTGNGLIVDIARTLYEYTDFSQLDKKDILGRAKECLNYAETFVKACYQRGYTTKNGTVK